ncbi:MAG: DUF1476 domain-containing protein [Phycisphaerales bacterium]|nr:DUF1476 domain-containing protein [Phycisphaerales bacterium]
MSGFSQREEGFEKQFAFDAEKRFRAQARRNKLLAQWVGEKVGMTPAQVAEYAAELQAHDLKAVGDADVEEKVLGDLKARGVNTSADEVRAEMHRCLARASEQTASEG